MKQTQRRYADGIGIRLLERISEKLGFVFSASEALEMARDLGISASHAYKLLHSMAASSYLRRLGKGVYVVETPLAGGNAPHAFAIATHLVRPSAISRWSAFQHWGFVDQIPLVVTASTCKSVVTPGMRGRQTEEKQIEEGLSQRHAAWVVDGIRYEYTRIRSRDMFGVTDVWVDSRTRVPMFDRERALLDAFVQLQGFGAGGLGTQVLSGHWSEIDVDKLSDYAKRMERPRVLARVTKAISEATRRATPTAA